MMSYGFEAKEHSSGKMKSSIYNAGVRPYLVKEGTDLSPASFYEQKAQADVKQNRDILPVLTKDSLYWQGEGPSSWRGKRSLRNEPAWESVGTFDEVEVLAHIKVHRNSLEPQKFGADAIAKGNHIFLTAGAEGLLRHEAGHVLQQKKMKIAGDTHVEGQAVSENEAVEAEADAIGSCFTERDMAILEANSSDDGLSSREVDGTVLCGKNADRTLFGMFESISSLLNQLKAAKGEKKRKTQGKSDPREELLAALSSKVAELQVILAQPIGDTTGVKAATLSEEENIASLSVEEFNRWVTSIGNAIGVTNINRLALPSREHVFGFDDDVTGLHAYSDYRQERRFLPGGLPEKVIPLGYIGDRTRVHILHWTKQGDDIGKLSTMLPVNIPERVSTTILAIAQQSTEAFQQQGYNFQRHDDETVFPVTNETVTVADPRQAQNLERALTDVETSSDSRSSKKSGKKSGKKGAGRSQEDNEFAFDRIFRVLDKAMGESPQIAKNIIAILTEANIYKKISDGGMEASRAEPQLSPQPRAKKRGRR